MKDKVSIIVPVYNVEKYINKCIDSIISQKYKNIEIVLVDDGSTDLSGAICDEYEKKHSFIRVIHQNNGGASSARKKGVELATGDFVMFVDSDDWIDELMIEVMIDAKYKNNVDLVICSYSREYGNGNSFPVHIFDKDIIFRDEEYHYNIYRRLYGPLNNELANPLTLDSLGSLCMKLYPKTIFSSGIYIHTNEIGSAEDVLLNMSILHAINSCIYIDKPYYCYRKTNSESLTSSFRPNLVELWDNLYNYMEKFLVDYKLSGEYKSTISNRIALGMIGLGLNIVNSKNTLLQNKKKLDEILNRKRYIDAFKQLDFKYFSLKWKLFFYLALKKHTLSLTFLLKIMFYIRKLC